MNRYTRGWFLGVTVIAAVTLLASSAEAATGWHRVRSANVPNTYDTLSGVFVTAPGDAWAVGEYGPLGQSPFRALAEHWTGSSWAVALPAGIPKGDEAAFDGVGGTGRDDVWAVGLAGKPNADGTSLAEHWNGSSWTRSAVAEGEPPGGDLVQVSADAPDDVWAVGWTNPGGGVGYSPLIERFNGTAWQVVPDPSSQARVLTAVDAVSPASVWVLGFGGGTVTEPDPVIEHFNGTRWTAVKPPLGGPRNIVSAISGLGPDDIWAVGQTRGNTTLIEHYDGTRWSVVASPNGPGQSTLTSVTALSASDVWATGATGPYQNQTLTEHWNGTTWSIVASPNPGANAEIDSVSGLASGPVFAVGNTLRANPPYERRSLILQH